MPSSQEVIFYLYLSITGIPGDAGEDMLVEVGPHRSQSACRATGQMLIDSMRESIEETEVEGHEELNYQYQCTDKRMQSL